ncbi:MAG TPA: hypothetical protein VFM57_07135 [Thermoleophilaceae bacterium]|nr:hypothetical protein [Thermoleophilaceae bacterium]
MRTGLAAAVAALTLLLIIPSAASAKRMLPWPSDAYTKRDKRTDTGVRLNLRRADMPRNKSGTPINPVDINRADGFSPGSALLLKVPGLDTAAAVRQSKLPPLTNLRRGLRSRSPILVFNARTGKRHPIWAELDSNARRRRDRLLIIRPARNFEEGERYVVVLRNLRNARGRRIDGPGIRGRHAVRIRRAMRKVNTGRHVYTAWDFTVASEHSLAGRMLHIRNDAFRMLGDTNLRDLTVAGSSPAFTVDAVTDLTPAEDDRIARKVEGTITVPCYVTNGCAPGGRFSLNRRGLPRRLGTTTAKFHCNVPRSALDPAAPPKARPSLYGHGLLGRPTEIDAGNVRSMSNEHNFVFCATAWAGFSNDDVAHIVSVLSDLSGFNTLADRMQQGFLNMLFLGRAMIHPQGLSSHAAFQKGGQSVLDTTRLFFDGNSQGGIMGGGLTAVAPDFDRAVLGVPGMNYSTLLQRSVDFDAYAAIAYPNYRKVIDRQLWFQHIQLLWDRADANGYAHHMTSDPLPNTPRHQVLMHVAFGDHQVSDTAAEVQARTIGARGYRPVLDPGRSPWRRFQLIPSIESFPFNGSAIVMWDTGPTRTVGTETKGTDAPPAGNTPNRSGDDPHENPRATPSARVQKSEFLKVGGQVVDVCGGAPCHAVP